LSPSNMNRIHPFWFCHNSDPYYRFHLTYISGIDRNIFKVNYILYFFFPKLVQTASLKANQNTTVNWIWHWNKPMHLPEKKATVLRDNNKNRKTFFIVNFYIR
jgi:hypothetical protein